MTPKTILICTVGTSLVQPNLERLKSQFEGGSLAPQHRQLVEAYISGDTRGVAQALRRLPPTDRLCGAEINSIAGMIERGYVDPKCGLYFLHSETERGRQISQILKEYYRAVDHQPVELIEVADLQDDEPKRFRSKGLRNLVREIATVVRRHSPLACAINATGGYKAQIAIAVVLGQALGVTVYYKHELFSEVIAFPPLPVALDFQLWMKASGLLSELASDTHELLPASRYQDEWDERYESLVERVKIDDTEYLELSPAGQIFYETFKERFHSVKDLVVPPLAPTKRPPRLERAGWPGQHPEIEAFMRRVTEEVPFVVQCETFYFNPDLSERTRFLVSAKGIVGVYSDGRYCVKFLVETTAQTEGQRAAAVAALNEWLKDPDYFRSREEIKATEAIKERDEALAAWERTQAQLRELQQQNEELRRERAKLQETIERLSAELAQARGQHQG